MDNQGPGASGLADRTSKPRLPVGVLVLKWKLLEGKKKEWGHSSGILISGCVRRSEASTGPGDWSEMTWDKGPCWLLGIYSLTQKI